ncbi:peptidase S8/S53 domain-containing protein [Lactarius quietus]|nr:peptidase S8/S53 domain-containing protein [Lactarius quietus]
MRYPHLLSALFFLAAARPLSDPEPRWDDIRVMHAWEVVPAGWESPVTPPAGVTIDLSIALNPETRMPWLMRYMRYGAYLSQDQVAELVAPHPPTLKLVHAWLERHGVPSSSISTSHGGNWLTLTSVPVSKANYLLNASYQCFLHAETNETIIRTLSYALPEALHPHVQTIVPTTFFGSGDSQTLQQTSQVHHNDIAAAQEQVESGEPVKPLSSRDTDVTPSLLRSLYKTETYAPADWGNNIIGTVGHSGLSPRQADLSTFMAQYRLDSDYASYVVVLVSGNRYDSQNPSVEMNLDVQYATAMSYPISQLYYSISSTSDPFVTWFDYILTKPDIPQTISMTYLVVEQTVPPDYAKTVCDLFMQLGARGVSVLCPSGNSGVGDGDCIVTDSFGNAHVQFRPTFPASCPYVTAVGGTTGSTPETEIAAPSPAVASPPSLGPSHTSGTPYPGISVASVTSIKASSGRGIPDVSAQALRYVSITRGQTVYRDGTNCATPTVVGIISMLNDYQVAVGRPALGFLNPWLYGDGLAGLRDITSGSNPGCGTDGFSATTGWDPVTGLGTPDFVELQRVLPHPPY